MTVPARGMRSGQFESRGHHMRQILLRSPQWSGTAPLGTDRASGSVGRRCSADAECSSDS